MTSADLSNFMTTLCRCRRPTLYTTASVLKDFLDVIVIYPDSHNIQITDYFTNNENNVTLSQMLLDFDTGIENLSSDKKAISEALAFIPKDIREKIINDIEEELQKKSDDSSAFMRGKKLTS